MQKQKFGVYIGRFQPCHNAHLEAIKFGLERVETLIIIIGSAANARTIKNPWTSDDRIRMICESVAYHLEDGEQAVKRLRFVEAKDYLYNDAKWVIGLQASIDAALESFEGNVLLFGHDKDRSTYYLKMFPQWEFVDTGVLGEFDATKVREQYFRRDLTSLKSIVPTPVLRRLRDEIGTPEYERLYMENRHIKEYMAMWEGSPFPPVFVTTDAIVIKSGHLLVVRRKGYPGQGLIALPGGFLGQNERIVDGALRELKEETGIRIPKNELKKRIVASEVFDHPNRSLCGRRITHAFCIDLGVGDLPKVKGADDADKAWWMSLNDVLRSEEGFFEDHFHIVNHFVRKY